MTAKQLWKLENQNQKKHTESIKKIVHRLLSYQRLLWKWIAIYIFVYVLWSVFEYFFVNWEWFKNIVKEKKNNWLSELILLGIETAFALGRGCLFSMDGFITAQLKAPFGQICFFINKSEEIGEQTKDQMIEKITESNEHCKETFKKFGILAIANETVKILTKMDLDISTKKNSDPKNPSFYLVLVRKKLVPLLSYIVPIYFSDRKIKSISEDLEEIWNSSSN